MSYERVNDNELMTATLRELDSADGPCCSTIIERRTREIIERWQCDKTINEAHQRINGQLRAELKNATLRLDTVRRQLKSLLEKYSV